MFQDQLPSLFERERGGIMRARVRKDYSRIFYYRSVRDGYLCVAYDGLDELMEQEGVTTQMARDLCCDLTTFLLDLIQSDEKPEVGFLLAMIGNNCFGTLAAMRRGMESSYPYPVYTEMLSKLISGLKLSVVPGIRPADHLKVEWNDMYHQCIQLVTLILLLKNRTNLPSFDISVEMPNCKPEIVLRALIDEQDREPICNEVIWLQDEVDLNLLPERFRFKIEPHGIRVAICNATPEPHFRFGSEKVTLLSPSLCQFTAALILYAKAMMGFQPRESE